MVSMMTRHAAKLQDLVQVYVKASNVNEASYHLMILMHQEHANEATHDLQTLSKGNAGECIMCVLTHRLSQRAYQCAREQVPRQCGPDLRARSVVVLTRQCGPEVWSWRSSKCWIHSQRCCAMPP